MTWIVVGTSAGVGRALAEELASPKRPLLLASRDARDLEALAAHLTLTRSARVATVAVDGGEPDHFARSVEAALPAGESLEGIFLPLGTTREDDDAFLPAVKAEVLVRVNYLSVAAVIGRLLPLLARNPGGVVVGFGSVANTRGRGRNLYYGAAKRALRAHFEGLAHALTGRGVSVQLWILGYHDTGLAWGRALPFPKEDPAATARRVIARLGKGSGTFYAPRYWRLVTFLLRALPEVLFRKVRA